MQVKPTIVANVIHQATVVDPFLRQVYHFVIAKKHHKIPTDPHPSYRLQ
jgi:hypothetical protein